MEVVPTSDGEEDGVLWLRCPRCQGFLPKISSGFGEEPEAKEAAADAGADAGSVSADAEAAAAAEPTPTAERPTGKEAPGKTAGATDQESAAVAAEYEAMLAEMDVSLAVPYRPWEIYEIGDVIHHLAWDDCGVVVAKETLPGNRKIVKVYFEKTGIVRLIEAAAAES
jgi:hypothetical protein